jgi:hypothetical protein
LGIAFDITKAIFQMNTSISSASLMGQQELDREMDNYFNDQARERELERVTRVKASVQQQARAQPANEDKVVLSPVCADVKLRLIEAMKPKAGLTLDAIGKTLSSREEPALIASPGAHDGDLDAGDIALNALIAALNAPDSGFEGALGHANEDATRLAPSESAKGDRPHNEVTSSDSCAVTVKLLPEPASAYRAEIRASIAAPLAAIPAKAIEESRAIVGASVSAMIVAKAKEPKDHSAPKFTEFPVSTVLGVSEFDDPLREMAALCRAMLIHKDYLRVRDDYCRLSITLNLVGKLAPGWRPQLKAGAGWGNAIHKVIHRDQVVIDLHWCYSIKMPLIPQDAAHVALFSGADSFHFELAWELAGKQWKGTYRASEALCLTPLQQCQMLTLRGPELLARLDDIESGRRKSEGKSASKIAMANCQISQWAERNKHILSRRDSYEKLWRARELLGHDATNQQIAELHAYMLGGEVQDRATIRDKLKSLDKHVCII